MDEIGGIGGKWQRGTIGATISAEPTANNFQSSNAATDIDAEVERVTSRIGINLREWQIHNDRD